MKKISLRNIWKTLWIGIRAKLSWMTGSLIALTVIIFSYFTSVQEREILTESYRKQTEVSRSAIQNIVSEIDSVSENLIQIEKFRMHISMKKKELQKYQITQHFTKEREYKFLGLKIKAGGLLGNIVGKDIGTRKADSYFSEYYNEDDIIELEKKIRIQIHYSIDRSLTDEEWKRLKIFAAECTAADAEIKKPIDKKKDGAYQKIKKIEKAENECNESKAALNKEITKFYIQQHRRKLEEMGLNTELIRIQIFEKIRNNDLTMSFDSFSIDPSSGFAKFNYLDFPIIEKSLSKSFERFNESDYLDKKNSDTVFWKESDQNTRTIHTVYSPYFRNPNSTTRAQTFTSVQKFYDLRRFIEDDRLSVKHMKEQGYIEKLRKRLGELKKNEKIRKPVEVPERDALSTEKEKGLNSSQAKLKDQSPKSAEEAAAVIVPANDPVFKDLYNLYRLELEHRNESYNSLKSSLSVKKSDSNSILHRLESMESMRDSALEDTIVLRHKKNDLENLQFYSDAKKNAEMRSRWKMIRRWIVEGKSEMPPPELRKLFSDAAIIKSRSEAEEIMWELDSFSFFAEDGEPELSQKILQSNFSGVIQTLVDGNGRGRADS